MTEVGFYPDYPSPRLADWRHTFMREWRGVGKLGRSTDTGKLGRSTDTASRASRLLQALEATCRAMHNDEGGSEQAKAYADNLGHNIAFVSSPLSMLAIGEWASSKLGSGPAASWGVGGASALGSCCGGLVATASGACFVRVCC